MSQAEATMASGPRSIRNDQEQVIDDLSAVCDQFRETVTTYARERPEVAALACIGVGFILGWKLKPW